MIFGLDRVWKGSGGCFGFDGAELSDCHGVNRAALVAVFSSIKAIASLAAESAFPDDERRLLYGRVLMEYLAEHLSIQTSGGLKAYLMHGAVSGTLSIRDRKIFLNENDITDEWGRAVVYAMKLCDEAAGDYGSRLFRTILPTIQIYSN